MTDVAISTEHAEYRLGGTLAHLTLGAAAPVLRVYDGTQPAPGGAVTTLLAEFALNDPPGTVAAGVLPITAAGTAIAANSGTATWCRFVNGNGDWSIDCRVSDTAGDAPVKLSDTLILAGGLLALISAVLG